MTIIEPPKGWSCVAESFERTYSFVSFARAGEFVAEIGRIADEIDHHPEVLLTYPGIVTVTMTSLDVGTVTTRDVRLAEMIDALV